MEYCRVCEESVASHATLHPCKHKICMHCLVDALANSYNNYEPGQQFACPFCNVPVSFHEYTRQQQDHSHCTTRRAAKTEPKKTITKSHVYKNEPEKSIYPHCTSLGSEQDKEKFPVLAKLKIPLGRTEMDAICRFNVASQILSFNSHVIGQDKGVKRLKDSTSNILQIVSARVQNPIKLEDYLRRSKLVETVLECMSVSGDKEFAATGLAHYLAKHYNEQFCEWIDFAEEIEDKRKKKQPFVPPADLVMYDQGNREDEDEVKWNIRYGELLKYKEKHGDCLVPSKGSKALNPDDFELAKFVSNQRSQKKRDAPALTPKRMELLESVGFAWSAISPLHQRTFHNDPKYHKAIAAKLYFQPTLTAREALLMSGFEEELASDDNLKKILNEKVRVYSVKGTMCQEQVEQIMTTLKATVPVDHPYNNAVFQVFGTSDIVTKLRNEGKLEPRSHDQIKPPAPPRKRQRDNSTSRDKRLAFRRRK